MPRRSLEIALVRAWGAGVRFIAVVIAVPLLAVLGCKGEPPPGPKTAEYGQERQELMERLAKKKKKKAPTVAKAPKKAPAEAPAGLGTVEKDFSYDASGRRDPFRSFEWERPDNFGDLAFRGSYVDGG